MNYEKVFNKGKDVSWCKKARRDKTEGERGIKNRTPQELKKIRDIRMNPKEHTLLGPAGWEEIEEDKNDKK